jgi:hypothetical protein
MRPVPFLFGWRIRACSMAINWLGAESIMHRHSSRVRCARLSRSYVPGVEDVFHKTLEKIAVCFLVRIYIDWSIFTVGIPNHKCQSAARVSLILVNLLGIPTVNMLHSVLLAVPCHL